MVKTKHPTCVFDGKYNYFRQDFVVEACTQMAKELAKDFEGQYIKRNITEKSEKGEDVDVRLEQSICKINVKNIKGAGKYISEYFANCVMPRKELEEKLKKR